MHPHLYSSTLLACVALAVGATAYATQPLQGQGSGTNECGAAAASSTLVGTGVFPVSTLAATTGTLQGQWTITNDVWFYWVAPATGTARLETCFLTSADTHVAAWLANNGQACPSGSQLALNDDSCGDQSRIQWWVTAGEAYFLQLGAFLPDDRYSAQFLLEVLPPPANDTCSAPLLLEGNGPHLFDTRFASTGAEGQAETLCGALTGIARDAWYVWRAPHSGEWALSTLNASPNDTKVAVYPASDCPSPGSALVCNDNYMGDQSLARFQAQAGQDYLVQIGQDPTNSPAGMRGPFSFVYLGADSCSTPQRVQGDGPHSFLTRFASTGAEGQSEALCGPNTAIARDCWFEWTATTSGLRGITVLGGSILDSKIAVYSAAGGCPAPGTALGCNDDLGTLAQSLVQFQAVAGQTYLVQLGQDPTNSSTGDFGVWRVIDPLPPVNDNCATPTYLAGNGPFPYDTTRATTGTQGQTTAGCSPLNAFNKDLWFVWTASKTGEVVVSNCDQFSTLLTFDTKLQVYAGAGCPSGPALACNDDAGWFCSGLGNKASRVVFQAVCGQQYTLQIGNYSASAATSIAGTFTITESGTACAAGSVYCTGDGSGVPCPCGNTTPAGAGQGCLHSLGVGGQLAATGVPRLSSDTLLLTGSNMPNSQALYFQGTTQVAAAFGDGLRCAGGTVLRLGTRTNSAGASSWPPLGQQPISVQGAISAPGVRTYQVWYRNAANYCSAATFNLTNGYQVTWLP